ncbi:macrophage activating glycoprotein [Favolaschia claudopus]|uniref:Macrophage activating glycoprotein n=1 Tax=Favolaschia claudopus TaxID=2862362 RepID=A0AAW0D1L8_9AGAR
MLLLPSNAVLLVSALLSLSNVVFADPEEPVITPAPSPTHELAERQVAGGEGTPILATLTFPYTALPTQVYPFAVLRGPQFGYNQCGAENASSTANCQTLVVNNASDFCLWGAPDPNSEMGNEEAKVVSFCTNPRWGGRPIPPGSIHGLQFMRTTAYIQIVGFIDNVALNLAPTDTGGELDPHGADLQGNPLGGVVYSLDPKFIDGSHPGQIRNWNLFVGSGLFCLKACYNDVKSPNYCENRYDLVGCEYNMPNTLTNGTFVECEGERQTPVGTYVENGQTLTWKMPYPLTTEPPYRPVVPASSNCRTFSSEQLFGAAPTNANPSGSNSGSSRPTPSGSNGSNGGSNSNSANPNPSQTGTGAAATVKLGMHAGLLVVAASFVAGGVLVVV